jgi:hypothetical protein
MSLIMLLSASLNEFEPISLEVYCETVLRFWVDRDNSSQHTFSGQLLTTEGSAVKNMPIKTYINDTLLETYMTDGNGCFSFSRNFDPEESRIAYVVQAVFEGTSDETAMLNSTDFEGYEYTVCRTLYCEYKPSVNMTQITIEPQVTQVETPAKTREEMQQETEQDGWLKPRNEFSWWFLWYRLHLDMVGADPRIDIIITPLALDVTVKIYDESQFAGLMEDAFDMGYDMTWSIIIGHIAAGIAARLLGKASWIAVILACAVNAGVQLTLANLANAAWKDSRTWFISFLASLISAGASSFIKCLNGMLGKFLKTLGDKLIVGRITSEFHSFWTKGLSFDIITSIPFIIVDVLLALGFYYFYSTGFVW